MPSPERLAGLEVKVAFTEGIRPDVVAMPTTMGSGPPSLAGGQGPTPTRFTSQERATWRIRRISPTT